MRTGKCRRYEVEMETGKNRLYEVEMETSKCRRDEVEMETSKCRRYELEMESGKWRRYEVEMETGKCRRWLFWCINGADCGACETHLLSIIYKGRWWWTLCVDICIVDACGDFLDCDHPVFNPCANTVIQSVDVWSSLVEDWIVR